MSKRMRQFWWVGLILGFSCGESEQPDPTDETEEPTAFIASDFETAFTEVRDCRFSIEHDGTSIQVYVNDIGLDSYQNGVYPFPEGTVIAKKEHVDANCETLSGFAVMQKGVEGTDSDNSDWKWQRLKDDFSVDSAAAIGSCVSCHNSCTNGRDFACTDP